MRCAAVRRVVRRCGSLVRTLRARSRTLCRLADRPWYEKPGANVQTNSDESGRAGAAGDRGRSNDDFDDDDKNDDVSDDQGQKTSKNVHADKESDAKKQSGATNGCDLYDNADDAGADCDVLGAIQRLSFAAVLDGLTDFFFAQPPGIKHLLLVINLNLLWIIWTS